MPDIKTEMNKLLNEWNKEMPTITQAPAARHKSITNNVSRILFDYIKAHPGHTINEVTGALKLQGFKIASTTSLVSQFARKSLIRKDGVKLYAVVPEYVPMPDPTKKKVEYKPRVNPAKVAAQAAAKVAAEEAPAKSKFIFRKTDFDPKKMIEDLSAYQARDLYVELKTMFGA